MPLSTLLVVLGVVVVAAVPAAWLTRRKQAFRRRRMAGLRGDEGEHRVVRLTSNPCVVADGGTVLVDAQVRFRVVAPGALPNPALGVEQFAAVVARNELGGQTAEEAPFARGPVESRLRDELRRVEAEWGIHITDVAVTAITPEPGRTPATGVREDPLP